MDSSPTAKGDSCDWHTHPFDELCLVSAGQTLLGHGGKGRRVDADTLFLFRAGERHGYWNEATKFPRLSILHYRADHSLYRDCPSLVANNPEHRVWRVNRDRRDAFRELFVKVQSEHSRVRSGSTAAESAWLRLLLVTVSRWKDSPSSIDSPVSSDPALLALWRRINDAASQSADLDFRAVANYDSLRHRFRREFGVSPQRLAIDLRMERAKNLLLESGLSVKEVAARLGYARQHEFTRAFHRHVGRSPTSWRKNPIG